MKENYIILMDRPFSFLPPARIFFKVKHISDFFYTNILHKFVLLQFLPKISSGKTCSVRLFIFASFQTINFFTTTCDGILIKKIAHPPPKKIVTKSSNVSGNSIFFSLFFLQKIDRMETV